MLNRLRKTLFRRALDSYKRRKRRNADLSLDHALAVVRTMLRRTAYGFLVTNGANGWPSARLVQPIVDETEDFVIYVGTDPALRKAQEVRADARVTFAIEDEREQANLVLYGRATIENDPEVRRRRWLGTWRIFFPDGPTSDGYVAIRIDVDRMEVLSFRRNVVAEPFGLRPLLLVRESDGAWAFASDSVCTDASPLSASGRA